MCVCLCVCVCVCVCTCVCVCESEPVCEIMCVYECGREGVWVWLRGSVGVGASCEIKHVCRCLRGRGCV